MNWIFKFSRRVSDCRQPISDRFLGEVLYAAGTRSLSTSLLVLGVAFCLTSAPCPAMDRAQEAGLEQKLTQINWQGIRGVNYIPSYSSNTYEMWRYYDHHAFDRELGLASAVGFNSVRLWLNYAAYAELGSKMIDEVQDALRLCAQHHLEAVIILFDSCGVRTRKDTQWLPAPEAYDRFRASPRFSPEQKAMMHNLFDNYVHGFGANTLVPVASDSPMMALLYQRWVPTPGNDRLGPDWYSKLEGYVDAVIGRLSNNPSILLWDLMNEPEWASEGPISPKIYITPEMKKTRDAFLEHFHAFIKNRYPNEILGIGWATLQNAEAYANLADVVTFHIYGDAQRIQSEIEKAQSFSKSSGKRVLITETLANWDFGSPDFGRLASDEEQLAHYRKVLPVLVAAPIGWLGWGLVISHDFDPFTDIFYPDGHPRPAAVFAQQVLRRTRSSSAAEPKNSTP